MVHVYHTSVVMYELFSKIRKFAHSLYHEFSYENELIKKKRNYRTLHCLLGKKKLILEFLQYILKPKKAFVTLDNIKQTSSNTDRVQSVSLGK